MICTALTAAAALLLSTPNTVAQEATPSAISGSVLPSVADILSHIASRTAGLEAYEVPVTIHATVKKVISLPITLRGTRYFAAPDKEALKLKSVPAIAKAFSNLYASLGTPATWPQTYDLEVVSPDHAISQPVYELRGTYKHTSTVDHILLDVDLVTYDPVEVRWFYKNGATIVMNLQEESVGGYRLPAVETLDVHFPSFSGHATIDYGDYAINMPLPESVFAT